MLGGMGTTLAGTGAQSAATASKDQAQTLKITGGMQIASGAMTLGIAAGNIYHAVQLGREKSRLNANATEFETQSTAAIGGQVTEKTGESSLEGGTSAGDEASADLSLATQSRQNRVAS